MIDFALPSSMLADKRLWQFLTELTSGEPVPIADTTQPPWFEPGVVCEIPLETYFGVLERFRPNWRFGSLFVSGEGPWRLFWHEHDKFFGRELTAEESRTFGELAGRFLAGRGGRRPGCYPEVNLSCVHQFRDRSLCRHRSCCRLRGIRYRYAQIGRRHGMYCPGRDERPFSA